MIFYRDLDLLQMKENILQSERFKRLFPNYDETNLISDDNIPSYNDLLHLLILKESDDEYVKENVNSKTENPLPWPMFNTVEGKQYLAKKMKEIRISKIISKSRELYEKTDDEIEPIKYQLHYLRLEPVFKELEEDKSSPNYVKLLSDRIEKYELAHQNNNYEIDNVVDIFLEREKKEEKKYHSFAEWLLAEKGIRI